MHAVSRQVIWARAERDRMKRVLGGHCTLCGGTACLTFDCIVPTGHEHHQMSSVQRTSYYRDQMRRGNLQLLCFECNTAKSNKPMARYTAKAY